MGYILDRYGVKAGFILNFLACALHYYILSITDSIEMLYLSKIPSICMGGFLCAQCAMAKVTVAGPDRIQTFGRLTTAYTVGGVIGPYLGGVLG
jgi:OCT family organic cation transporter-like MFS transporter 18